MATLQLTELIREVNTASDVSDSLTLTIQDRTRSRFRAVMDSGAECAVILPRGNILRDGDVLGSESGARVVVRAQIEPLSSVSSGDSLLLTRAAYHLGNRHVALQIAPGELRYLHDHVLDEMVRELGLAVAFLEAPFQPESGAYGAHHHAHSHADHC
jgi:urease accessory protein